VLSLCILGVLGFSLGLGQTFAPADLPVIGLLVVLEGVLSIDNALVLGILAKRLRPELRDRALFYGLAGAVVFRLLAITTATYLLSWNAVKLLGGGYLLYIAVRHLYFESQEKVEERVAVDREGQLHLVELDTGKPLSEQAENVELESRVLVPIEPENVGGAKFWSTVLVIELADIAFAVDSILAAIALVGPKPEALPVTAPHPKIWVIMLGGFLGVILMRLAASVFIKLLERFPRLDRSAYYLVGLIGLKLLVDYGCNSDWISWGWDSFTTATDYHEWLSRSWPLGAGTGHGRILLADFHDWRRPEFLVFWLGMAASVLSGFRQSRSDRLSKGES
jgi:YkoY family integral membrane protein